jgi:ABC transporter substrate binding protein
MKRRAFISLLGGAAFAWPLAARAQQPGKLPMIGLMVPSTPLIESQRVAAFLQRLRQLGWIENRNVAIEYRWAEGRSERFVEIATEFVQHKVDLIVASTTPAVIAAKQATATIPIVFATVNDPVSTGLVASLARPGGNLTGLSNQLGDTASKRLELLREVIPGLRRLGIWANVGNPGTVLEMGEIQAAARTLALEVITLEIRRAEDIGPAFEGAKGRADARSTRIPPQRRIKSRKCRRPRKRSDNRCSLSASAQNRRSIRRSLPWQNATWLEFSTGRRCFSK